MKIDVTADVANVVRYMERMEKQQRYAIAVALTKTATDVRTRLRVEMDRVFDRPTGFTLNSLYLKRATRQQLEARVWLKDDFGTRAHYLMPQIEGGERRNKRFEAALMAAGALPAGYQVVPGAGATLDTHGNMSRGQIIQILSQLRITMVAGHTRNMPLDARKQISAQRKAGGRFFIVRPGGKTKPGIYQREFMGRSVTPVAIFVRRTTYRAKFRFYEVADRVIRGVFAGHFAREFENAKRTAR